MLLVISYFLELLILFQLKLLMKSLLPMLFLFLGTNGFGPDDILLLNIFFK